VQLLRKGRGRERGEVEVKKKEGERRDERGFFRFSVSVSRGDSTLLFL
jgi:hypothetical protein